MNTIIHVEQLKDLWRRIADLNAWIKEISLEIQALKGYVDASISGMEEMSDLEIVPIIVGYNPNSLREVATNYV
jgi:DNA-binding protein YbaB